MCAETGDLDEAQAGDLILEPCTYTTENGTYNADCGTLVVPENRADAGSRLIALPVTRIRATVDDSSEPIFRLEGGPGISNMTQWGMLTLAIRQRCTSPPLRPQFLLDCRFVTCAKSTNAAERWVGGTHRPAAGNFRARGTVMISDPSARTR